MSTSDSSDPVVFGIDPGTNCGWSVRYSQSVMVSGVWDLSAGKRQHPGTKFRLLADVFQQSLANIQPNVVVYEDVRRHVGTIAAHVYGGIMAIIKCECARRSIPMIGIPVGVVKKFATQDGKATKEGMQAESMRRWPGFIPSDDNEADARWIAECGYSLFKDQNSGTR